MRLNFKAIAKRLQEPSTYVALGALGALFGVPALEDLGAPENAQAAAELGSFVALWLGVVLSERVPR